MKNENLILAISLLFVSLISLIYGLFNKLIFEIRLYIGLSLLCFCIFSFFKIKSIARYLLGALLILSLFDLIHFTPFSIGLNFLFLKIYLIPFLFTLIFYFLNRHKINEKISNFNKVFYSDKLKHKNDTIEFFKIQFQNLSETEIEKKLKEDLVPEAKEALMILKDNLNAKKKK